MVRHHGQNVFVDGDYMVLPDSTRVLAIGAFSSAETNNNNNNELSSPWFVGGISGDNHFPPMPLDDNNFPFLTIDMDSWYCRNPCKFSLVRIAPYKYASLWSPDEGKHSVSLSVFTICPPTSPPPLDNLDLNILLGLDLLCIDDVPVGFEAERVHIPLWQEYGRKVDCFRINAAIAV
ncbi:hypothetical protein PHJA_001854700 [Phtheirospermum japonicum]|uniref:Uncharacterized protein n=1 Tax=Phtheirospermum japonicum TaxID=374723 RepID=A0A830CD38_9LAMI|nr:hypothetical protein PHJA_001854700 [Phtheirospermum japonicum]